MQVAAGRGPPLASAFNLRAPAGIDSVSSSRAVGEAPLLCWVCALDFHHVMRGRSANYGET